MRLLRTLRAMIATVLVAACAGSSQVGQIEIAPAEPPAMPVATPEELPPPPAAPNVARGDAPRAIGRCDASAGARRFTIAHVNDMQARYTERIAGASRYAYVAGYLEALKDEVPETLVMDAGDDYEKGSIADLRSMGEATRRMIQALPIDVRTIGNHDFAYGEAALLRDVRASAHPVLAANVAYADGSSPFLPYAAFDVGCVKVGVVGLVTQNYGANDLPTKAPYDGVLVQSERYAEVLDRIVHAHRGEVDVMIALDHLGLFEDASLAARVSGVDLFIGGHSEDLVRSPLPVLRPDGTRAYVAQAGHYAQAIGRLDLAYFPREKRLLVERARIVEVTAALPRSERVADLARSVEREYAPEALTPVGFAKSGVPQGAPMADLVWRAAREQWGIDALLVGPDVFWDGLPEGPITLQRLYDAVLVQREPAGTSGFASLYVVELSGKELAELLAKARGGPFASFGPAAIAPRRTYRFAIEKRAMVHPELALRGAPKLALRDARYAGEMIDVLEAYARSRTRRGLPL